MHFSMGTPRGSYASRIGLYVGLRVTAGCRTHSPFSNEWAIKILLTMRTERVRNKNIPPTERRLGGTRRRQAVLEVAT